MWHYSKNLMSEHLSGAYKKHCCRYYCFILILFLSLLVYCVLLAQMPITCNCAHKKVLSGPHVPLRLSSYNPRCFSVQLLRKVYTLEVCSFLTSPA